ncbi:MAG: hypothetical protein AABZ57_00730, partial [Candidatus Margulisiibacteriota bacterium]
MAKGGRNCVWVGCTGVHPFKRCAYCENNAQECFGIQFFVIAAGIIGLLVVMFTIRDLPVLAVEITMVIIFLISLLTLIANKETNEIIIGNAILRSLNEELEKRVEERTKELKLLNVELQKDIRVKSDFLTNIRPYFCGNNVGCGIVGLSQGKFCQGFERIRGSWFLVAKTACTIILNIFFFKGYDFLKIYFIFICQMIQDCNNSNFVDRPAGENLLFINAKIIVI